MLKKLIDDVERLSRPAKLALSAALMAAICLLDQLVGTRLSLLTFFWAPVAFVTWSCGMGEGLFYAALSVALGVRRDMLGGRHYGHPFFLLWDVLDRGVSFYFFVWGLARLKKAFESEAAARRATQDAERLKSSMLSLMSHEIANAISVLKMSVFLAREHEANPSPALQKDLETIDRVLVNMDLASKNFLDNARLESGRLSLKLETVDLGRQLADLLEMFRPLLSQRGLTVTLDAPAEGALVRADRAALSLVLSNLIGNAVKYTKDGGLVAIHCEPDKSQRDSILVSVVDTGIGMSAEDTKKVLAGFVRLPEGKLMARGYGLGLKTVYDLLQLHGSHLEIESERGKGSRFSFTLPRATGS